MATTKDYTLLLQMRADVNQALKGIKQVNSGIGSIGRTAAGIAGSLGLAFSVAGIASFVKSTVDANGSLGDLAQKAGVSVETLSSLNNVAQKNGANLQDVQGAFVKLAQAATNGGSAGGKALQAMGINLQQFLALKPEQQLDQVAQKFAGYQDGAQKAALATALFGRAGVELIPTLNQVGQQGLANVVAQAKAAGVAIGQDAVDASAALANTVVDLRAKLANVANTLLVNFRPQIDAFAAKVNDPAFIANVTSVAEAITQIGNAALTAASKIVEFTRGYAEYVAKVNNGAGAFDVAGMQVERSDIQAELKQRQQHPILSGVNTFLAGSENNAVQNAIEGGRPRIQSMSTKDLQARLAQLDQSILHAAVQTQPKNPQTGDTRGLFVGLGQTQAPIVPTGTTGAAASGADAAAKAAAAAAKAQDQLTQSLVQLQGALDPVAAAWAQYNDTVAAAEKQEAAILAVHPEQKAALDAQVDAVKALAGAQRDAAIAEQQRAAVEKQLSALQTETQGILSNGSRQEQMVQAEQNAGLITEYTARQRLLQIHGQMADALTVELQKWQAIAQATGDPQAIQNVQNLSDQIAQLRMNVNDVQLAFQSGFANGMDQALEGLATRTMSIGQAVRTLAQSIVQSLAQVASRALTDKALDGLKSLFGGGAEQGAGMVAGAAAVTTASGTLTAASAVLGTSAAALQAAAITLMAANSAGSSAGMFNIFGLAGGGAVRGPGTSTSDSIPAMLSDGEYVVRAAAVRALGVRVLDQINRRGYAAGGVVHPLANAPTPADLGIRPRSGPRANLDDLAANRGAPAAPQVGVRIINSVDPQFVTDSMASPQGETVILNAIARNAARVKQTIG